MRIVITALVALALSGAAAGAQETKPVPKDSARVSVPGCTKGRIFTAGPRTVDEPGSFEIPEGMHLRMNGPKKLMNEIKAHEGSLIEITGLVRKGQYREEGIPLGGGVRIGPGPAPGGGTGMSVNMAPNVIQIDVEGWRPLAGACRTR